jgi:hypothetical protein
MSTTSKVVYLVQGFLGLLKETGSVMTPTGSILFLPKPLSGFDSSLSNFRSKPILLKATRKRISALLPLSIRTLVMSNLSMWTVMTMASVGENKAKLTSWEEKVLGMWDHLVWVIGPSMMT